MRRAAAGLCSALMIVAAMTGCGGSGAGTEPTTTVAATPAESTPTPSPSAPSKAEDAAALKQVIVTAADLGEALGRAQEGSLGGEGVRGLSR